MEANMKRTAVLIYGAHELFERHVESFNEYLQDIGCITHVLNISQKPLRVLRTLLDTCAAQSSEDALLIAYEGHGAKIGWENYPNFPPFPYHLVDFALSRLKGSLYMINNTCYGGLYVERLKTFRSPEDTCFIAPW